MCLLPLGTVIRLVLLVGFGCYFGLAVIFVVVELPL